MNQIFTLILFFTCLSSLAQKIVVSDEHKLNLDMENYILTENQLSVNPNDDSHWLLSGMFVNSLNDSEYGVFASFSRDCGRTWSKPFIAPEPEGADPWGIITNDGIAILSVLGLSNLITYRSLDGGKNWLEKTVNLGRGFDHQTMVYDPLGNKVYLVSDRENKVYFNYSTDDGASFPNSQEWQYNNLYSNTMTAQLSTNGKLLIPFANYAKPEYDVEKDKPKVTSTLKSYQFMVEIDSNDNYGLPQIICESCEKGFPVLAIDHSNTKMRGNLYYVCSSQSTNEILFHYSLDHGKSWTAPKVIRKFHNKPRSEKNPFTGIPQVTTNKNGVVGIIWQDRMDDPDGECNRLYFTASLDGGKSFLDPVPVSSEWSCMTVEKNGWAGKRYKSGGDYTGFISDHNGDFIVVWPDSREGISKLYTAKIKLESN
jgi:hypothetical protein